MHPIHAIFLSKNQHFLFYFQTQHSNVIGIQVLNPIVPESTEQIVIYDYQEIIESEVNSPLFLYIELDLKFILV